MDKKINFTENELLDLKTVLKIVEPAIGIHGGHLYRIYDVVFKKWYETQLGFTHEYIDADKCYIKIGNQKITAREITDELINLGVISKFRDTANDKNGNPVFHDVDKTLPVQRTYYKTI